MKNLTMVSIALGLLAGLARADAPKPPQEIADMAKATAGTWTCTGKVDFAGTMSDVKGTVTHKLDLDGWWIETSINANVGKAAMHMTFMTTYDPASKKWYRETANSMGGHSSGWGTQADKKLTYEADMRSMGTDEKTRNVEEMVSAKEVHLTGEVSKDAGKTWKPDHDITCKK